MKKELTLLALACPTFLFGQTQTDSTRLLNEVVITSQHATPSEFTSKVPATKHEVPLSLVSLSPQILKDRNPINLVEAVRTVPGMRPIRDYGGFDMFFMRGYYNVVVLNDGIRDERHNWYQSAPTAPLTSVDRIEVLRGANAMAVGHSALGGVINVIHKKPTERTHANASVSYGSWDTYKLEAGTSGKLAEGLTFRADFGTGRSEGWRHAQERFITGYLNLNYKLSPVDDLSFVVQANSNFNRGDAGRPHMPADIYSAENPDKLLYKKGDAPLFGNRRDIYTDPIDHLEHKNTTAWIKWEHDFGNNWALTNQLSYFYDDIRYFQTEDLKYLESETPTPWIKKTDKGNKYMDLTQVRRGYFQFDYLTKILTEQLELSGKLRWGATSHNLLLGYTLGYTDMPRYVKMEATGPGLGKQVPDPEKPNEFIYFAMVDLENPINNLGHLDPKFKLKHIQHELINSLYAQDFMRYGKLSVLAGLRLDLYNRSYQLANTNHKTIVSKGDVYKTNYLALTYRLGVVYDLTKDWNVYASTSNFFRPTRQVPDDKYIYLDNKGNRISTGKSGVFEPETAYQIEAGTHYRLGQKVQASLSVFHISKSNEIKKEIDTDKESGKLINAQIGRSTSTGLEVDLVYNASKTFDFNAGYGLTIAKIRSFSINRFTTIEAGNYLKRVPKHTAFGWGYFNHDFSKRSSLRLGLGFEHSSKVYGSEANDFEFPSYTLLNAMASYQYKTWRIQLNADNLGDKLYYVGSNGTQFIPSPGRSFNLSLHYNF